MADKNLPLSEISEISNNSDSTSSKQLANSTVSVSKWKRWLSIIVLLLTTLDITSTYSIVWTSLFPYLLKLTNGTASTVLLGVVVAGYSMSRLVMSPILGFWSDKRPTREPLVVSFIVSLVANIAYIYASALPSGGQFVVLVARIVLGGCAGGVAVVNSYAAAATTEEDRRWGLAGATGSQTLGFVIGPVLALMFVPLGEKGVSIPAIRLHFNMYTGPAYLSALLDIINILLLILLFREYKIEHKTTKSSVKKSMMEGVDWLAVLVSLAILFVIYSTVAVLETMLSPYSMDEYAWTRQQAVLYNSILISSTAFIILVMYVVIAFVIKWVDLRVLMMVGLIILAITFFMYIPISNQLPKLRGNVHNNSTVAVGCRYPELKWCKEVPQLLLPLFIAATLISSFGYSMALLPAFTMYSKLFGPYPQGTMMGIVTAVGSLSRGVIPLYISFMYDHTGPQITFASVVGIMGLAIIILMVFCHRMVPFGHKRSL